MLTKTLHLAAILVIAFLTSFSSTAQTPNPLKYPTEVNRPIRPTKINQTAVQETQEQSTLSSLPESILNAELKSARGGSFKLSSYLGNIVVLNFWATWVSTLHEHC